jgi:CelD/BcsL family acetyltransferase involved in cellulose biosynthesis
MSYELDDAIGSATLPHRAPQAGANEIASDGPVDADRYEVVTDLDALAALREEWNALYDRAAQPYFSQSFAWCWTSWEKVSQPRGRRLHCLVARRGGRVVLIWAFVSHRLGPWSVTRPLGPETTEYTSVLVEEGPDVGARIAQAWKALRASCATDIVMLPLVGAASTLDQCLAAETLPVFIETDPTSYVSVARYGGWAAYHRSLPNDMRRGIVRRRRRLQEQGMLSFDPAVDAAQRAAVIDWILERKREWLAEMKLHNPWLLTPTYREFLLAMAASSDARGRVVVSALRLGDRIIAADVLRADDRRVEDILTAFDPAFATYGPGQIILEECLKWALEQGRDFDFRIGSEAYKAKWTNEHDRTVSYEFGATRWGAIYILYRNAARRASNLRYLVPPAWRRRVKGMLGRAQRS